MSFTIAMAGKGGTGKTTLAGLLVRYLIEHDMTPVLAVDADSNANLNEVLGLELVSTLGNAREQMKTSVPTGMTKDIYMEIKAEEALVEAKGFDLIAMGQPEGQGCYCAANTILTGILEKLLNNYKYIVIDNEAGMEHMSRLTTNNIDLFLIVTDASRRGVQAARRITELADSLNLVITRKFLIINQYKWGLEKLLKDEFDDFPPDNMATVPVDENIFDFDMSGRPTIELPHDSPALQEVFKIYSNLIPAP